MAGGMDPLDSHMDHPEFPSPQPRHGTGHLGSCFAVAQNIQKFASQATQGSLRFQATNQRQRRLGGLFEVRAICGLCRVFMMHVFFSL